MSEREIPYEVPELEYVEVDPQRLGYEWGHQTPIILCSRCEENFMDDPARNTYGEPMPEHLVTSEPVCSSCSAEALGRAFRTNMVQIIDETLGLGETDREAIRSFIETVFTDPKKILQVQDLDNRVQHLEAQNGRLWTALAIEGGLLAVLIASVVAIALALAS